MPLELYAIGVAGLTLFGWFLYRNIGLQGLPTGASGEGAAPGDVPRH